MSPSSALPPSESSSSTVPVDRPPARRILLVTGLVTGGVGTHVQQTAAGLRARGHTVCLACPAEVDELFGFSASGLQVEHITVGARPNPRTDLATLSTLRDLVRGVDVVHAHGVRAGALAVLGTGVGSRSPVPVVVTVHNAPPHSRSAAVIHAGLERAVASRAALVLAVSPDLEERMASRGAALTGPAVVAAPRPDPSSAFRPVSRADLGVPEGGVLAVTVGRLAQQKGLDTLVEAVAQARESCPGLRVVVAGEGSRRGALESLIAERGLPMTLLGRRSDVPALLAAADIAVSAARWEGQPVWLQEALHAGLPIVATDAGGTRSVLGGAARLVPVGDASALAAHLVELVDHPAERERMRTVARARSAQLPGERQAVDALERAYARVLPSSTPNPRVD